MEFFQIAIQLFLFPLFIVAENITQIHALVDRQQQLKYITIHLRIAAFYSHLHDLLQVLLLAA